MQFCNRIRLFLATQGALAAMKRETASAINQACQQVCSRAAHTQSTRADTRTYWFRNTHEPACRTHLHLHTPK